MAAKVSQRVAMVQSLLYFFSVHTVNSVVFYFSPQWSPRFRKDRNGPSLLCFFSVHTVNSVVFYFSPQWSPRFRKGVQSLIPQKSISSFSKNTTITGFFVCQRKGKFDIGVISTILGKACYMDAFPYTRIKQNVSHN
jgi:hypothetical protein